MTAVMPPVNKAGKPTLELLTAIDPRPQVWYQPQHGKPQTALLHHAAADVAFEDTRPVRTMKNWRGKTYFSGLYWAATNERHVPYETWLERRRLTALDYSRNVAGITGQPMWVCGRQGGTHWEHLPDFFVRHPDGTATVVEVKNEYLHPRFVESDRYQWIRAAFVEVGWDYLVVTELDPQVWQNLAWLSRYRRPVPDPHGIQPALVEACREPTPLMELVGEVGDPLFTLAHLWRLLWTQDLTVDLTVPFRSWTFIHPRTDHTAGGELWLP